jgi:hypothetical protein
MGRGNAKAGRLALAKPTGQRNGYKLVPFPGASSMLSRDRCRDLPSSKTSDGGSLMQWCAYYGDVSALKLLLEKGETLQSLGEDMGLNAAAFHRHWRLCQFFIESGADVNSRETDTGETPLHAALSPHRAAQRWVVKVLLDGGADPNIATNHSAGSRAFMRDVRIRGETAYDCWRSCSSSCGSETPLRSEPSEYASRRRIARMRS